MTSWTKGPWLHHADEVYSPETQGSVCIVLMHDQGEANRSLIAAAPELYEALRVMAHHHSASPHIGLARAALSKAEGKS